MSVHVQRVYEKSAKNGEPRFLVDRLWPRGIKKSDLPMDGWLKDVAPSDRLRKWFGHEPKRWAGFVRRYRAELDGHPDAWQPLRTAARHGGVTLLFGAKDETHNNAIALKDYLEQRLR